MKKMNKTVRRNALTYSGVILAYIIMQSLSSTGHISSTLSGLLVPFCYYVILAVSLNLTVGVLGELSLGHAGFMCVGAFTSVFFTKCTEDVITNGLIRFPIALLIGAAYLLAKKVITIRIPAAYLLSFAVFVFVFGQHNLTYVLAHLCGGGLIFGAFFMATDYVTSPITPRGQILFGILLGVLTGLFRIFGGSAEGVSYAIIISNLLVPLIEKVTLPVAFGKEGKVNE